LTRWERSEGVGSSVVCSFGQPEFPGGIVVGELKSPDKAFAISKREVMEAWDQVRSNKGAPGVDGCSIEEFEKDLRGNLYKIWNRMSSGSYFPPPVLAVEIP
jgi:RNA-directed DNA polymerase